MLVNVVAIGPIDDTILPSYMLKGKGSNTGMSVMGGSGEFCAELMVRLSMQ